uniref:Programmed cell death protein 2 C-terminal domain-containing protein n=1 Tax=Denticeps clupeoides TaxID=299321 RepID=A0AAY4CZQ6_9TELE
MAAAQETPLIGLSDGAVDQKRSVPTSFCTNKIGDRPDQIPVISLGHPGCGLCSSALAHVVQVYCPLEASPYHRTINVFACVNPACLGKSESWKVLRSQCLESDVKRPSDVTGDTSTAAHDVSLSRTDWCDEADDWGAEENGLDGWRVGSTQAVQNTTAKSDLERGVSKKLQSLSINPLGAIDVTGPTFQAFYISVVEETDFDGVANMEHAHELLREYEKREGLSVMDLRSCESEREEKYEKTKARHGDDVFSCFMKKISICPEQVLRYSRNGTPLFITEPPSNMKQLVPVCSQCGSPRTFEFQLMPALVSLLQSKDPDSGNCLALTIECYFFFLQSSDLLSYTDNKHNFP